MRRGESCLIQDPQNLELKNSSRNGLGSGVLKCVWVNPRDLLGAQIWNESKVSKRLMPIFGAKNKNSAKGPPRLRLRGVDALVAGARRRVCLTRRAVVGWFSGGDWFAQIVLVTGVVSRCGRVERAPVKVSTIVGGICSPD